MKNYLLKKVPWLLTVGLFCLMTNLAVAQTSSITITASRTANPTLQWQGISYDYGASTAMYSVTNGSEIYAYTDALTSTDKVGRYNFSHPTFTNSRIQTITLQVNCSASGVPSGIQGLASITIPQCSQAWSASLSNASAIGLYQCLNNAPMVTNNSGVVQGIATASGGLPRTANYVVHDPASGINSSSLWDPASTSIAIGLLPLQYDMTIASISVTIVYTSDPSISNNTVCCAQSFNLSGSASLSGSTPGGGNGIYAYQWQSSPNNSTWTNISGATAISYTTPTISQTMYYRRIVTSGTAAASTSLPVTITVYPAISNNTICCAQSFINVSTPTTLTASTPTGGTGSYTYRWISSLDGTSWTTITGATNSSYTPPAATQTMQYKRVVSSGTLPDNTSSAVNVTVTPGVTGNAICCAQTYTNIGDPTVLSQDANQTLVVGGSYTIQWESGADNSTWTAIAGETNASYDPPVTTQPVYFRRKITMTSGTVNNGNPVLINIVPDPNVTNNNICCNQFYDGNADPDPLTQNGSLVLGGGNGTYAIQWYKSVDNSIWSPISGATNQVYDEAVIMQTTYFKRIITSGTAPTSISNVISVTINAMNSCTDTWAQKSVSGITERGGAISFSIGGKGYIGLGQNGTGYLNDLWEYDPLTELWTQKAPFPGAGRLNATVFVIDNLAYVGLGEQYTTTTVRYKDFYAYSPVTNSWVQKADFPKVKTGSFGATINNSGYVLFGTDNVGYYTDSGLRDLWQYLPQDLSNGTDLNGNPKGAWVQKQSYPAVTPYMDDFGTAVVINNKLYGLQQFATVADLSGISTGYLYEYDPNDFTNGCDAKGNAKGNWIKKKNFPALSNYPDALFSVNGKGYFTYWGSNQNLICSYDPLLDSYSPVTSPLPLNYHGMSFAIGGQGYTGLGSGDLENNGGALGLQMKLWKFAPLKIATGNAPTSLNAGATFPLTYFVNCSPFISPMPFRVLLSDVNGSFNGTTTIIGSGTAVTSGTTTVTIPLNTPTSSKYRIGVFFTVTETIVINGYGATAEITHDLMPSDNGINISIIDQYQNTAGLYADNQNGFARQWFNNRNGLIGSHTIKDNDIYYKADLDGDGSQELIAVTFVSGSTTDYIDVLKFVNGNWTLLWSNNGSSSGGGGIYPYRNNLIVGDYDGDGKSELLGNDPGAGWTTLFKFSNGNFQWVWSDNGNSSHAMRPYKNKMYSGDFDGNGKTEILGCSTGDWTTSFIWNGSNFVWAWSDYGGANPFRAYRDKLIVGDFDNDGKSELLGLGTSMAMFNFDNNAWTQGWSSNGSNNIAGWSYPFASTDKVMSANIDGDGKVELMFIQREGGVKAQTLDFQNNQTGFTANFQTSTYIGDWSVADQSGKNTNYFFIKAKATDPAYLMAIRKYCTSYTAAMYKANNTAANYRTATVDAEEEVTDSAELAVYPNPTENEFNIHLQNASIKSISIYNTSGQVVFENNNVQSSESKIISASWNSGLYLIKVIADDGAVKYSKVIIN